ncbi:MAG: phage recombination protein Bet [Deltaproteobacteria bacterium]|nr:MAG: phage recombination protein Bet [Deltaproteobacteria bacterium]
MSSNALVKADFTKEQLAVIQSQFFPSGATKAEQDYCFSVARELGLNPILREIHFVPRRAKLGDKWINKVEPMIARDGFLSIAHRSGQLAGIETVAAIRDIPQLENGKWVVKPQLVAVCSVWRKDSSKPFVAEVHYNEYVQCTADGAPTKFWAEKPATMLKKVAESQALRKAFNVNGVYCIEELGAGFETDAGEIVSEAEVIGTTHNRSHLAVVSPPVAKPAPPAEIAAEDVWSEPAAPATSPPAPKATPEECGISDIISLLEAKSISYDLDMETGTIAAKSYDQRQLLKDNGFRWNADTKSWVFTFEPPPF